MLSRRKRSPDHPPRPARSLSRRALRAALFALGPDGKEIWRVRLGAASPVATPTLTSDGTLVVVTAAGQAWGISPSGAVRFTTSLGVRGRDIETAPLALRDGGLVVASGPTL